MPKNNEIIYTTTYKNFAFLEIIFYLGFYEVYFRPSKKRYGYFLMSYDTCDQALNYVKNFNIKDMENKTPFKIKKTNTIRSTKYKKHCNKN